MEWLDVINFLDLLFIYYQNNPTKENFELLNKIYKDIEQEIENQIQYINKVKENFKNENKCFTNN